MDRMRDRLDKIARRSMSAPAGPNDAAQSLQSARSATGRPSPVRQSAVRQGKSPIPRSSAGAPTRPTIRTTNPPARTSSSSTLPASRGKMAGDGDKVVPQASRRPVSISTSPRDETARTSTPAPAGRTAPSKVGAHPMRPPATPATPEAKRTDESDVLPSPHGREAPPEAGVRGTPSAASRRRADWAGGEVVADALDTDRILELPARVTAARKQRQMAALADVANATPVHPSEPSAPLQIVSTPARKRADVAAEMPPPVALPVRQVPAKASDAAEKATPARKEKRILADVAASADTQADEPASADNLLPENIEPVGGAIQRFLTVLAERRRQRASGGGDGNGNSGEPPRLVEDVCPICGGAGYVRLDVPIGDPRFGQPVPCKCKEREFEERRRMEEERRVLELDRFFSLKPFGDKTFETFNPRVTGVKEAYEAARTFAEDPTGAPFRWLVLMGGTGVGKTHLAAAIAHERLEARSSVFFAVVPDLLDHLRAAFAPSAEMPYNEMFETVREVEMLILDDLGSENSTAWATEKLFQIINYRYNFRMPTVITTNSRLFEHMDERIASRLADTGLARTVVIEAPSRRPHPARKQAPPRQAPPRW